MLAFIFTPEAFRLDNIYERTTEEEKKWEDDMLSNADLPSERILAGQNIIEILGVL